MKQDELITKLQKRCLANIPWSRDMKEHKEPLITIESTHLTTAQAMTVRVAIEDFAMSLSDEDALGDDEHGREMRKAYLQNIGTIRKAMKIYE